MKFEEILKHVVVKDPDSGDVLLDTQELVPEDIALFINHIRRRYEEEYPESEELKLWEMDFDAKTFAIFWNELNSWFRDAISYEICTWAYMISEGYEYTPKVYDAGDAHYVYPLWPGVQVDVSYEIYFTDVDYNYTETRDIDTV